MNYQKPVAMIFESNFSLGVVLIASHLVVQSRILGINLNIGKFSRMMLGDKQSYLIF